MHKLLNKNELLDYFKIKDKRTLYKRLSKLEVPILLLGKDLYVRLADLENCIEESINRKRR